VHRNLLIDTRIPARDDPVTAPLRGRNSVRPKGGNMSLTGIAGHAGVTTSSLQQLIAHGSATAGLAGRLGVTTSNINDFINGSASAGIASALGTTSSSAQELRNLIGREGAIGLIIGLVCGRAS
jgi:hypothetical protein